MKRREFLKSVSALAASTAGRHRRRSPAKAQSRRRDLADRFRKRVPTQSLLSTASATTYPATKCRELEQQSADQPRNETVDGKPYYDKNKFKMELADDMKLDDMSVTFKLKKKATFQDGNRSPPKTSNGRSTALAWRC